MSGIKRLHMQQYTYHDACAADVETGTHRWGADLCRSLPALAYRMHAIVPHNPADHVGVPLQATDEHVDQDCQVMVPAKQRNR